MTTIDTTVSASTDSDNAPSIVADNKSAYAQYCEKRGVTGLGIYIDNALITAMDTAAAKTGMKRNEYMIARIIAAVQADGVSYTAPTKTKKETASQELARLRSEMAQVKAERENLAKAQEELIAQNTPHVPTPPTLKANAETGKIEKAA